MFRLGSMAICLLVALVMFVLALIAGFDLASEEKTVSTGPQTFAMAPASLSWKHSGPFGTYDRSAAQRGLQVYKEVCAGCHSLEKVAFRNLIGIGLSVDEVKAFAKEYEIADLDESGEEIERPGKPSDYFPSPFANVKAAAAGNGGAVPPDLSLIIKARANGDNYIHSLLTGYSDAPGDFELNDGSSYNSFFAGRQLAMAAPLSDDAVEYIDGTATTVDQMARDVVVFLAWASEPKMEARKSMGVKVMLFLLIFAGLMYVVKRRVWSDQH